MVYKIIFLSISAIKRVVIMAKIAFGSGREPLQLDCQQALVVEFICTFIFVFVGVGAAMTCDKLNGDPLLALFFVAMAHALVVAVMIAVGSRICDVHLNPAVTVGLCIGGHSTVVRSILYCIDQLIASVAACALLKYLTGGLAIPIQTLASGVGFTQGVIMEIVLTFSLLFTVYATIVDPKRGSIDGLGPLLTGLVIGANAMVGGPFSGASMNPARSFGPAFVSGDWTDQWVYWVGPIIGGGLAGFIYQNFFTVRLLGYDAL